MNHSFLRLTKNGTEMLDISLTPEAWQIGRIQSINEKTDLESVWYV